MALVEKRAPTGYRIFRRGPSGSAVPLARRNFVANGHRLVRSLAGIFAALLMMVAVRNCDAVFDTVGARWRKSHSRCSSRAARRHRAAAPGSPHPPEARRLPSPATKTRRLFEDLERIARIGYPL